MILNFCIIFAIHLEIAQTLFSRGIHNQLKYSLKNKHTFLMCHAYTTITYNYFREYYKVKETEMTRISFIYIKCP